jgi:hypothetical protein
MEMERGSSRSHSLQTSLSKRLWTYLKADYVMMMTMMMTMIGTKTRLWSSEIWYSTVLLGDTKVLKEQI